MINTSNVKISSRPSNMPTTAIHLAGSLTVMNPDATSPRPGPRLLRVGAIPVLLLFASFVGGSAGSTAGGMKVIRWLLIYKQGMREIMRLVHPSAEIPVKLGNTAVPVRVVDAVWGFFAVYVVVFSVMLILMMATGLDQVTAFSAVAATLNNLGPGLGDVATGFVTVSDPANWIAVVGMLLGRLEIFTLLVLITPTFWRH